MPEWVKRPPVRVGLYLRVNAGHQISKHDIIEIDGVLNIFWGDGVLVRMDKLGKRLDGWWWYGPIPKAPEDAYGRIQGVHQRCDH